METDLTEKEILARIKFHEEEAYRLRKLLPSKQITRDVSNLGKNDIIKLQGNKIQSEFLKQIEVEDKSHFFYNKKVVLTGEFPSFENRNIMAQMLQSVGADVQSTVSKTTDYVIVGKKAGPKKLERIKEFNIETFTEHEFIKLF